MRLGSWGFWVVGSALILHAATVDTKIQTTKKDLSNYENLYSQTHEQLTQSAQAIQSQQAKLNELDQKIAQLNTLISSKKEEYGTAQSSLETLQKEYATFSASKSTIEAELSRLLAKELSLYLISQQKAYSDTQSLIQNSVYEKMRQMSKEELLRVQKKLHTLQTQEKNLTSQIGSLQTTIESVDTKKEAVLSLKKEQKEELASLEQKHLAHQKRLEASYEKRIALRDELQKLHIIKEDAIKQAKAQKEREEQERLAREEAQKAQKTARPIDNKRLQETQVKKYSNLYEKIKTKPYTGPKAIAPLKNYEVVKKFGPYTDPIYNIKVFNESVSLKPTTSDTVVRSVLNGTVILTKNSPVLGNFVIIEHDDGLHTVYAHLDQIVPNLPQGKRVKQGHVIGRVTNELTFEVTQKNYHIDPLQLIR